MTQAMMLILLVGSVTMSVYRYEQRTMDVVPNASVALDTLDANAVDVITERFEGLTVATITVVPAIDAMLECRVFAPGGKEMQTGPAHRCKMVWVVPRTGAYRIEVRNKEAFAVPYSIAGTPAR